MQNLMPHLRTTEAVCIFNEIQVIHVHVKVEEVLFYLVPCSKKGERRFELGKSGKVSEPRQEGQVS